MMTLMNSRIRWVLCALLTGFAPVLPLRAAGSAESAGSNDNSGGATAATGGSTEIRPHLDVRLDTSRLVNLAAWGSNGVGLIEAWYPKIAGLLGDPPAGKPASIELILEEGAGIAATSGDRITVFAGWIRAHPEDVGLVIHELVHVVQAYPSPEPGWITEGLADYIRFWHFEARPQTRIDKAKASFRDSYRTTGAFFAWVEKQHPGTVRRVHAAMRKSAYRDEIFQQATGRSVEQLWGEFLAQWRNT
jgi:hypothetical protein